MLSSKGPHIFWSEDESDDESEDESECCVCSFVTLFDIVNFITSLHWAASGEEWDNFLVFVCLHMKKWQPFRDLC